MAFTSINGAPAPYPVIDKGGQVFDVAAYGATGNAKLIHDAVISGGSLGTLNSASANFTVADVGKLIGVAGAGAAGATLNTTIASRVSSTSVTLTASASGAVTDAYAAYGTDDTTALVAAAAALVLAGGGTLLLSGLHLCNTSASASGFAWCLAFGTSNIAITGKHEGCGLVSTLDSVNLLWIDGSQVPGGPANWATYWYPNVAVKTLSGAQLRGASSLQLATNSDAAAFTPGDLIIIKTGHLIDSSPNDNDGEINQIVTANASTGALTLSSPLAKEYQQEFYVGAAPSPGAGSGWLTSPSNHGDPAPFGVAVATAFTLVDTSVVGIRLWTIGQNSNPYAAGQTLGLVLRDCNILSAGVGFNADKYRHGDLRNNYVHLTGSSAQSQWWLSTGQYCSDVAIEDNTCIADTNGFLHLEEGSARVKVRGNRLLQAYDAAHNYVAIGVTARAYDIQITGNTIIGAGSNTTIEVDATCTGGGLIANNDILSTTPIAIYVLATGWSIAGNNVHGASLTVQQDVTYLVAQPLQTDGSFTVQGPLAQFFLIDTSGSNTVQMYNNAGVFTISQPGVGDRIHITTTAASATIAWAGTGANIDSPGTNQLASNSSLSLAGAFGVNGAGALAKPTITGSKGGNAALASLLTALANYGLVTDSTT